LLARQNLRKQGPAGVGIDQLSPLDLLLEANMSDQRDRLGDKLHLAEVARENQWARQRDAEIIDRLRQKYLKPINCPQCKERLDARVAIGVGARAWRMRRRSTLNLWAKRFSWV
jgi:hypothetical protein